MKADYGPATGKIAVRSRVQVLIASFFYIFMVGMPKDARKRAGTGR